MESFYAIVIIVLAIIQIMLIVKFFDIASDVRSIKNLMINILEKSKDDKDLKQSNNAEEESTPKPKVDNSKIPKQGWILLIVIALLCVIFFILK